MTETSRLRFVLTDYAVEHRRDGWYFGPLLEPAKNYRGPYTSTISVTLMIARLMQREVYRRSPPSPRAVADGRGSAPLGAADETVDHQPPL